VYLIRVSNWTRVIIRVSNFDTCIKYTCPIGRVYLISVSNWKSVINTCVQLCRYDNLTRVSKDTCQFGRVSTVTGTVDTRQNGEIFVVKAYKAHNPSIPSQWETLNSFKSCTSNIEGQFNNSNNEIHPHWFTMRSSKSS
jgi:hypothetical protein